MSRSARAEIFTYAMNLPQHRVSDKPVLISTSAVSSLALAGRCHSPWLSASLRSASFDQHGETAFVRCCDNNRFEASSPTLSVITANFEPPMFSRGKRSSTAAARSRTARSEAWKLRFPGWKLITAQLQRADHVVRTEAGLESIDAARARYASRSMSRRLATGRFRLPSTIRWKDLVALRIGDQAPMFSWTARFRGEGGLGISVSGSTHLVLPSFAVVDF